MIERPVLVLAEIFSAIADQLRTERDETERDILISRMTEVVEAMSVSPTRSQRGRRAKASALMAFAATRPGFTAEGWELALSLASDVVVRVRIR